ncbi:MAG: 3-hydroxy-5-phosphonooxypentane-2,4-dione thiolase [Deltaproteobacteria bacterium]|nr:3-hydroxy-5-phosphonooxypentane-2,4-dione thiolase [Deltaproteobacteria bacterium]
MDWGMSNRMSRLFREDGNCMFLPIDHGYFQGPTRKLERPGDTIAPLTQWADGLFVTRGVLRNAIDPALKVPIILRVSGGSSVIGHDLADEDIFTSIEEVIRVNASAVGVSVFVGTDYERQSLMNLAKLVSECERYGIPVMAVTAVGKELEKRDSRYLGLCCRIAAELGARVVKTYWCENFEKVSYGCPVPVIMAGGPKVEDQGVFNFVHDGMTKGAKGVNLGRNIWQHEHPVAMMKALFAIVHEKATPADAMKIFKAETQGGAPKKTKKK